MHVNKQDINILVVHEPTLTAPSAVIRAQVRGEGTNAAPTVYLHRKALAKSKVH